MELGGKRAQEMGAFVPTDARRATDADLFARALASQRTVD